MFLQRAFRCLKKKLFLSHRKGSYNRLNETPDQEIEETHHHQHPPLTVPKGFVPIIVGEFEDNKDGKKYMIQVEYLSTPTFKAMIEKLKEEQQIQLDLEDDNEGPMKLPCSPEVFEKVLEACDEVNPKGRRRSRRLGKLFACGSIGYQ